MGRIGQATRKAREALSPDPEMAMMSKSPRVVLLYALTGGALIAAGLLCTTGQLGAITGGKSVPQEKLTALSSLLTAYGVLLLALALLRAVPRPASASSTVPWRYALRGPWQNAIAEVVSRFSLRQDSIWILGAVLVGITLRGFFLDQPMGYDESYTFLHFINRGFRNLFYYPLPNNHILHTVLVQVSSLVWGSSPAVVRLPAFLAGVASIPLTFVFCRVLGPKRSGFLAAVGVSVAPYLVVFSSIARGYSLVVCISLVLALAGLYFAAKPALTRCFLFSLIGALGMLTMPSSLFAIAGLALWVAVLLLASGRSLTAIVREFAIPFGVMFYACTLILYTPAMIVSGGVRAITANEFVAASSLQDFLSEVPGHFRAVFAAYTRDVPAFSFVLMAALFLVGVLASAARRTRPALLLLPSLLAGSAFVFILKRRIPYSRTWIYWIPFLLIFADFGLTWLIQTFCKRMQYPIALSILCLASLYALSLMARNAITLHPEAGCFAEIPFVAQYLKSSAHCNDVLRFHHPIDTPLLFYLSHYEVGVECTAVDENERSAFFIVQKNSYTLEDLTAETVTKAFELGDTVIYRAPYAAPVISP